MRSYCPVAYGSPMSNSMKRKDMGSNAWQSSTCKYMRKRGRKRHPLILRGAPGGTRCCCPHTWWLHRKALCGGGGWMRPCQDISAPSQRPEEGCLSWGEDGVEDEILFYLLPQYPLPFPSLLLRTRPRGFSLYDPLLLQCWRRTCKNEARAAEREEVELTFQLLLVQQKCFEPFSQVTSAWGPWFAFAVVLSTHSCIESVGTRLWTNIEWCKMSERSASCDHKLLHS